MQVVWKVVNMLGLPSTKRAGSTEVSSPIYQVKFHINGHNLNFFCQNILQFRYVFLAIFGRGG